MSFGIPNKLIGIYFFEERTKLVLAFLRVKGGVERMRGTVVRLRLLDCSFMPPSNVNGWEMHRSVFSNSRELRLYLCMLTYPIFSLCFSDLKSEERIQLPSLFSIK